MKLMKFMEECALCKQTQAGPVLSRLLLADTLSTSNRLPLQLIGSP